MIGRASRRWAVVVLAAAVIVTVVTACSSAPSGASRGAAAWVGYTWRIVEVRQGSAATTIPVALNGFVALAADHTLLANDGVNTYSGSYTRTDDGYRPRNIGATLVGYVGRDPVRLTLIAAVRALTGSAAVVAGAAASDSMQFSANGYTVRCTKKGIAPNEPPPSAMSTHS